MDPFPNYFFSFYGFTFRVMSDPSPNSFSFNQFILTFTLATTMPKFPYIYSYHACPKASMMFIFLIEGV